MVGLMVGCGGRVVTVPYASVVRLHRHRHVTRLPKRHSVEQHESCIYNFVANMQHVVSKAIVLSSSSKAKSTTASSQLSALKVP